MNCESRRMSTHPRCGGIVLCGGQSRRMGTAKATLPFGPELMLARVVRLLRESVGPVVVVAARGQDLPKLPHNVTVAYDRRDECGPLEGLAVGLGALPREVDAAYATSCDVPLLNPAFVSRLIGCLGAHDVVVPRDESHYHPLAAIYRTSVLGHVEYLISANRMRPFYLFERVSTLELGVEKLRDVDPDLDTLRNLNNPEEYLAALAKAGYAAGSDVLEELRGID